MLETQVKEKLSPKVSKFKQGKDSTSDVSEDIVDNKSSAKSKNDGSALLRLDLSGVDGSNGKQSNVSETGHTEPRAVDSARTLADIPEDYSFQDSVSVSKTKDSLAASGNKGELSKIKSLKKETSDILPSHGAKNDNGSGIVDDETSKHSSKSLKSADFSKHESIEAKASEKSGHSYSADFTDESESESGKGRSGKGGSGKKEVEKKSVSKSGRVGGTTEEETDEDISEVPSDNELMLGSDKDDEVLLKDIDSTLPAENKSESVKKDLLPSG